MNNQPNLNSILEYLNNLGYLNYAESIQYKHALPYSISIPKIDEIPFTYINPLFTDPIPSRLLIITIDGSSKKDIDLATEKEKDNKINTEEIQQETTQNLPTQLIAKQDKPLQNNVQNKTSNTSGSYNTSNVPDIINKVIKTAELLLNKPFIMGSKGPNAFDCSGLCYYAYKANGINIPVSTLAMIQSNSQKVDINDVRPGDIIITKSTRRTNGRHARLVTEVKDGVIHVIEAKGKKWGVVRSTYKPNKNLLTIRRFVTADKLLLGGLLNNLFLNNNTYIDKYLPKLLTYTHTKPEKLEVEPIIDLPSAYDPFSPFNFGEDGKVDKIIVKYEDDEDDDAIEKLLHTIKEVLEGDSESTEEKLKLTGDLSKEQKKGVFEKSDKGKTEFFKTLFTSYQKVLKDRGLDPDWAYILTAYASIESAYGNSLGAHYNYGGVKVTDALIEKGTPHLWSSTSDWFKDKNGNIYKDDHLQPFRAYSSIEDYCNKVINLLSGLRYLMFLKYNPHDYVNTWYHILDSGYSKSNYEELMKYAKIVGQRVDELKQRLKI